MTVIGLDGDGWQMRACLGDEWRWHVSPAKPWDAPGWLPARVPGSVIDDLWRAGEVPDPYAGRNSLALEWVPARAWIYRRRLDVPALAEGDRAVLDFDGVEHAASVFLDGEQVCEHEGGFVPFQVDVTPLGGGSRLLAVVVHPAPANEPQVGVTSRVRVHKSRMGYGWDFCPRMIHQGIWRPVRLRVEPTPFLADVAVAAHLAEDLTTGTVTVDADLSGPGHARLTVRVRDGDRLLAERSTEAVAGTARVSVSVREPRLWWPNGAGEPVLHRVEVILTVGDRKTIREYDVGFRRVRLRHNDGAPADALPYTLVVNGRRVYLNGWNWVPIDPLYGVPRPAKLAHLLRLAADAHVNLLRVWGGGLIETPEFYGLCDRLGLLVWQEFEMSSSGIESVPASDPDFVAMMVRQARAVVPRLRHHPSLAIWCGGNELEDGVPLDDSTPVLAALRGVVAELHPDAAWLPTSPSGPAFAHQLDAIAADPDGQHDVHGPWEHHGVIDHYRLYDAGTSLLHSEFGVEGMTNRRTLAALVPESDRWPADKSNPVYAHLGAWWNNEPLVQQTFGYRIGDLDTLRRASQLLQADGLRYAVEANRRRAFRNSGTIPWQFNESYPNAWCTAAVDYRGDPKPAYHAVRRVYRPWHACARLDRQAWAGQAEFRAGIVAWGDAAATVTATLRDSLGTPVAERSWEVTPPPGGAPVELGDLVADLSTVDTDLFLLDVTLLDVTLPGVMLGVTPNRYLLSRTADLAPVLDLDPAAVDVATDARGDTWQVTLSHRDGPAALGLTLEDDRDYRAAGWAVPDDNLFHLLRGESRTVSVTWRDAEAAGRVLRLSGFNIAERVVGDRSVC